MELKLFARAKINLLLDVHSKRPDGYHNVEMVMQTLQRADIIKIRRQRAGIKLVCDNKKLPLDERNLAYKAARLFLDRFSIKTGLEIQIIKKIPLCAGLGGGSADAAAVLKGLNKIFRVNLSKQDLVHIGKEIGADVPFCIMEGTALAKGIGEILTPLNNLPKTWFVLAKPPVDVSTAWVYREIDGIKLDTRPDVEGMLQAVRQRDIKRVGALLCNVMEQVTAKKYPVIHEIKEHMMREGALGSLMTGSGPTVFGMFDSKTAAIQAYKRISNRFCGDFFVTTNFVLGGEVCEEEIEFN